MHSNSFYEANITLVPKVNKDITRNFKDFLRDQRSSHKVLTKVKVLS
jgi:hypothetical protein